MELIIGLFMCVITCVVCVRSGGLIIKGINRLFDKLGELIK